MIHISGFKSSDHACGPGAGRFESAATSIGCGHFERPATPPSGVRRGFEITSNKLLVPFLLLCFFFANLFLAADSLMAARASDAFFEAENCGAALRKNPKTMKFRDNWEQCIDKYQAVYRKDPKGPWAPASLFNAGLLYLELYKFSRNESDQKKGTELLEQVQKRFSGSVYQERAAAELQKFSGADTVKEDKPGKDPAKEASSKTAAVKQSAPASSSPVQVKFLKAAEACFSKLANSQPTENTRREWMLCVGRFHNAYLEDPSGALAAQALYMEGVLYSGLYKGLRFDSDQRAARENFEKILKEYPYSPFAAKASKELQTMPRPRTAQLPVARRQPPAPVVPPDSEPPPVAAPEIPSESPKPAAGEDGLAVVQDLRYWSNPNYTRVVVYADREIEYNHRLLRKDETLDKPPRLYVDLGNTTMGGGVQATIPINDDLLSNARAARYTLDSVRVVVDIKSFETYKVFSLRDPFRIVIDVWGRNGVAAPPTAKLPADSFELPPGSAAERGKKVPRGALARQLALGVRRIVVDPGHGGKDFGAPGFIPGVHEKDVVLDIAKRVAGKIRDELGLEAILTRSTDHYLTLEERTAFANTRNADLFVSIHTNASRDPRAYGMETYFLNLATDDDAIRVAAMENATSTKNISDLHSILNDLLKNAKINESSRLAALVQTSLVTNMNRRGYDRVKDKGVKQAPFYVLLGARMPSILIETSFISNREECRLLTSSSYQDHLADSIVKGIRSYIREISPTAFNPPSPETPG
jgi:N-acetylmuramoyl-L-alanine amidase